MPAYKCEHPSVNCYNNHRCRCGECRSVASDFRKDYYQQNRISGLEQRRKWALAHPENAKMRQMRYVRAEHGKSRINAHNRRAREMRAEGKIGPDAVLRLIETYGNACLSCGRTDRIEIDHVVPLIEGGSNLFENLQLLCRTCNATKWRRVIDYRPVRAEN